MKRFCLAFVLFLLLQMEFCQSVSMKQFEGSLEMMRSICAPKYKVTTEMIDNLRKGDFLEDQELKCYTKCIAQMAGTLSRKGELNAKSVIAQIDVIIPQELREKARAAYEHCKEVQNNYKQSCDKTFYTTKCVYGFAPESFKFP